MSDKVRAPLQFRLGEYLPPQIGRLVGLTAPRVGFCYCCVGCCHGSNTAHIADASKVCFYAVMPASLCCREILLFQKLFVAIFFLTS